MKRLIGGMAICSIAFIVRGIYRTIELNHGFHGALAENQMAFLLDTIPISIAIISFNVYHPSRLLPQTPDAFLLPLGSKVSV